VAPTVRTKVLISRGTPRFTSDTRRAVGSVAFDEDVENAVNITAWTRRKNSSGEMRESKPTDSEYTPNMCSDKPTSTVTTYHANARSRANPKRAVGVKRRQATANGANHITRSMIFAET